jgi:very-short-patch-repair endonuclease
MALARRQGGLLCARDLAGITGSTDEVRRRVRSRAWQEVLPGVIAPAAMAVDRDLLERAAMLWVPAGALSHFSAARRDGIWVPDNPRVWLTAPFEDGHRSRPRIEIVRTRHPSLPWRSDGVRRWTPAPRTIVDLAQCLDERDLHAVLLSAVRKERATAAEVLAAAAPLPGRAGLLVLRRVAELWTPERESLLEDSLHADVMSVAGDHRVERQYDVSDRAGALIGRADVAIPGLRLAFEADGLLFHSTDAQIAADQRRDRRFLAAGWQTARFREGPLSGRETVRRDLRDVIEARARHWPAA